jgi:uncharacterized protein YjbI with pentapeptide repeats
VSRASPAGVENGAILLRQKRVETDLRDEPGVVRGLRRARLSNAIMLRSDYSNADLREAELRYIIANDYQNIGWTPKMG